VIEFLPSTEVRESLRHLLRPRLLNKIVERASRIKVIALRADLLINDAQPDIKLLKLVIDRNVPSERDDFPLLAGVLDGQRVAYGPTANPKENHGGEKSQREIKTEIQSGKV